MHHRQHSGRPPADARQAGDERFGWYSCAEDWLLSAAGAVTIQGRAGDVAITGAAVPVGYVHAVGVRWAGRLLGVLVDLHGGRGD